MSSNHHTPWVNETTPGSGTNLDATVLNVPLGELDQAITDNAAAIAGKAATSHNHDDRYYTETELSNSGGGSAVHWDNVTNKPALGAGDVAGPATNTDDYVPQWNGADSKTLKDGFPISAAGKALIDDADAAAQRATLGVDKVGVGLAYQSEDKPAAGAEISILVTFAMTLPSGLTDSLYYAPTAPAAEAVVSIKKDGTEIGTLTVSTGNSPTFAAASSTSLVAGDRVTFGFPATQDASWAGVSITLAGVR